MVLLRTEKLQMKTEGGLFLPASEQGFYDGPMHLRLLAATVLSAGSRADQSLVPGTRVCFQRRFFAWWKVMEDRTLVGWVDDSQITAICDPDLNLSKFLTTGEGARYATATPL